MATNRLQGDLVKLMNPCLPARVFQYSRRASFVIAGTSNAYRRQHSQFAGQGRKFLAPPSVQSAQALSLSPSTNGCTVAVLLVVVPTG